ncbi:hypothetical protein PA7_03080 [Pseudonocardia asaccharolytica DSM 44247 = NBRC 16224]|uniref:Polysaccharide biosynthesis protein n=1 Tax=Pseudonocardia asaccharolytica DSM 44247 = NBRC 16224 TaxID=1123024 RepID=A0A511CV96_9PSEU|nr:hypothetical protein PA7_03080 [Pseudonocardia asaccharolytica DSM 44247 = NBRC 16224]
MSDTVRGRKGIGLSRHLSSRRTGTATHLALGLVTVGLAGYAFVVVVGHTFPTPPYAAEVGALTSVYFLINIIGPGVFFAVEQETSRAVTAARSEGGSIREVAARTGRIAAAVTVVVAALLLLLWPPVLSRVLAGQAGLLLAVVVAAAGAAVMYWVRGLLSGQKRLRPYALTLYLEGAARLLPGVVLLAFAVRQPTWYALAFALGALVAGLALAPALRLDPGSSARSHVARAGRSVAMLVAAGLLMQAMANLGPVVVTFRMPDALAASVFALMFVAARVPLFLFSPVQALLVPALARAVAARRPDLLKRHLLRALAVLAALGAVGVLIAAMLGPWAVQVLFNAAERPPALHVALLAAATICMMAALTFQAALVALDAQRTVIVSWVVGSVAFLSVLLVSSDPIGGALAAQLLGPAVVTIWAALGTVRAVGRIRSAPTP